MVALMDTTELLKRVEVSAKIMAGKPVIRGTRIPVELILGRLFPRRRS